MKSLPNRLTGRSNPQYCRPSRRFQPRFQALESRLLLAGPDCDTEWQGQERVDGEQAVVAPTQTNSQTGPGGRFGGGGLGGDEMGNHDIHGGGGAPQADFQSLIDLIMSTENEDLGNVNDGPGSTTPLHELDETLSLVVGPTSQVQDQVADLIAQLRSLQDLQITIEVRFITLQDNFFEQIGVDFDFDVDDNAGLTQDPLGKTDVDPDTVVGLDPSGNAPLDLSFGQNPFGPTVPNFGGFEPSAATIGFAILSDIEAFFLIQAVQQSPY